MSARIRHNPPYLAEVPVEAVEILDMVALQVASRVLEQAVHDVPLRVQRVDDGGGSLQGGKGRRGQTRAISSTWAELLPRSAIREMNLVYQNNFRRKWLKVLKLEKNNSFVVALQSNFEFQTKWLQDRNNDFFLISRPSDTFFSIILA